MKWLITLLVLAFWSAVPHAANADDAVTDTDRQAAYCAEASFDYSSRLLRLISMLQENAKTGEEMLARSELTREQRAQLSDDLDSIRRDLPAKEADRKRWSANLDIFMAYLQRLSQSELRRWMSAEIRKDQIAIATTYRSCISTCASGNEQCHLACNAQADASDASKRMQRCAEIAEQFR